MRTEFSNKTKDAAAERAKGQCENCTARLFDGNIFYDHRIPDAMGGAADLFNCQALCRACHDIKTHKQDVPQIAKAKRRFRSANGIKKPRSIRQWRRFGGAKVFASRER